MPYPFTDPDLLDLALRHASRGDGPDNERLEFLGDAVLDLIVADHLYRAHPTCSEGDLTELKSFVVSRTSLAGAARDLSLEARARVGSGMKGRALPPSVLANLYEAVLGAIYVDSGLDAARSFALATLAQRLEDAPDSLGRSNPKQELQRLGQTLTGSPPTYRVLAERGRSHARAFLVTASIGQAEYPSAWGRTIKEAERWAAHEALLHREAEAGEPSSGDPVPSTTRAEPNGPSDTLEAPDNSPT